MNPDQTPVVKRATNILRLSLLFLLLPAYGLFGQTVIQLGSGNATNSYFPLYYLWDYSYSQTIYTAAELGTAGASGSQIISKVYYKPTSSASTVNWRDWVIFMGNTTQEGFSGTGNYISSASMTQVFDGQIPNNVTANTWIEITLDSPFLWDGASNLVVSVAENTNGWGNNPNWVAYDLTPSSGSKGIYFYQDNYDGGPISPASPSAYFSGTSNRVAQIRFEITPTAPCTAPPTGGTTVLNPASGNPGSTVNGSVTGASYGTGLTYQWQYSDGGSNWIDISGATGPTLSTTAPSAFGTRQYRRTINCSGSVAYSVPATFTIELTYCTPHTAGGNTHYINNFTTNGGTSDINNNSGGSATGYTDFTGSVSPLEIIAGGNFDFSIGVAGGSTYGGAIWIDFNRNGTFEPGEQVFTTFSYQYPPLIGNITIPLSAVIGTTRMRILASYIPSNPTDPCMNDYSGEYEDYLIDIKPLLPCTTANAGSIPDFSVCPDSVFTLESPGATTGQSGLNYEWFSSTDGGTSWTLIYTGNNPIHTVSGGISEETMYKLKVSCSNGGANDETTVTVSIKDIGECYCTPSSTYGSDYIRIVRFLGTLSPNTENITGFSPGGYGDYTMLPDRAVQIADGGINVYVELGSGTNFIAAWVDWNRNGIFDSEERVYTSGTVLINNTTFGFEVPSGTEPGLYTIRIRSNDGDEPEPCGEISWGEAEDYVIEVIDNCAAVIEAVNITPGDGQLCGPGKVHLSAQGSPGTTQYRWYSEEFGGSLLHQSSTNYYEPELTETTVFWVTAYNGSCESVHRTKVIGRIDALPEITFTQSQPDICGLQASLKVQSEGDKEEATLFEEDFENSSFEFTVTNFIDNGSAINSTTQWRKEESVYIPDGPTWKPAIASGASGNKFAFAMSDVSNLYDIDTGMTVNGNFNTTDFLNLKLEFDIYYSYYYTSPEYGVEFSIEVSTDNGSNWVQAEKFQSGMGLGTRFEHITIDLNNYTGYTQFKFRFRYAAGWTDGIAIDNVRLFGDIPLVPEFSWDAPGITIYEEDCQTPYVGKTNEVCIKADDEQLKNNTKWSVTATVALGNGCETGETIEIENNTQVWEQGDSFISWTTGSRWAPKNVQPTPDHCVIIKSPVELGPGSEGEAKNLILRDTGTLLIKENAALTVNDFIINEATEEDFIVASDGNLLQINDLAANDAEIKAERKVTGINNDINTGMDYIYWSSPVDNQNIYNFSPGTPTPPQSWGFLEYNEATDYFDNTTDGNFIPGKGYAIRAESGKSNPYTETYNFRGPLHNGVINRAITRSGQGFNLVGNPYPSNIDFDDLFAGNSTNLYKVALFWTNNVNYVAYQQGPDYSGNNYAAYNATGGNPATDYSGTFNTPNSIVKVGQGFLIQKRSAGTHNLAFNNSMRVTDTGQFYSKELKDRYWLTLTTPEKIVNSTLIGYIDGATDGYEADFDTEFWGASDAIYSLIPEGELIIQGRQFPLNIRDVMPLGVICHNDGVHVIRLEQPEGEFTQIRVYLIDKELDYAHDLNKEPYKFFAFSGKYNERFEIRYRKARFGTSADANFITAAGQKEDIIILSTLENIIEVQLFDILGMEVYQNVKVNGKELRIPAAKWMNSILFAKIITEDGKVTTTKVLLK